MQESEKTVPQIIAGPILRRLEPSLICFWLVSCDDVDIRLSVCDETYSSTDDPDLVQTLCAGENLYYHLITVRPETQLPTDILLPYRLDLRMGDNWMDVTEIDSSLLYNDQSSLSFMIPSRVGTVLHGSCRKPHHEGGDGLTLADDLVAPLIAETEVNSQDWPSALVMSGDQIYADDVAGPMLHAIHQAISYLGLPIESFKGLSVDDVTDEESLYKGAACYYKRAEILPEVKENRAILDMLFDGVRKPIFTTDTANNHLITLHEHLIMYLMVWSPNLWQLVTDALPKNIPDEYKDTYEKEKKVIDDFVAGLAKVQRVMAHIPVAMIFDDHDISDDWNLNREWEEAVYNHPFSRRMVGNGLSAYLLSQGWGNNPDGFSSDLINGLSKSLKEPGSLCHNDFVDTILRFQGWEYEWATEPPLIVLDSRTRRWRSESSKVKPSGLLDWEALGDLQHKLFDTQSVLLVSPAPIYGVKLIETVQRLFTWFGKPLVVDAENWMAHPGTANAILNIFRHSRTPQNFVILSGDVHYSFVYDVEIRRDDDGPDIWQVTSSGFKNEFPPKLLDILDLLNRWLYSPRSPLNWFTKRRRMRVVPRKPEGHTDGRRVLNGSGIGLVKLDENGRPIDFRQILCDGRKVGFERMERHSRWQ